MPRSYSNSNSRSRSRNRRRPDKSQNPCRVWIGGLEDDAEERELENVFGNYGEVTEVKVRTTSRDTFAFIQFKHHEDAKKAIQKMDQQKILGARVKCNWASYKTEDRRNRDSGGRIFQIWIGRLSREMTERDIMDEFKEFGDILSCQLRQQEGESFCFVEYQTKRACEEAIKEMHNSKLDGERIVVDWSKKSGMQNRDRRSRSRGGRKDHRGMSSKDRVRKYRVERSRSRGRHSQSRSHTNTRREGEYKVEVDNIPPEMQWQDLKNLARQMKGGKEVTFARTFERDGISCGLIEFGTKSAMEDLIDDLDGKRINGFKVRMTELNNRR